MKISALIRTCVAVAVSIVTLAACDVETYDDAVNRLGTSPPPAVPPPPGPPPPPPPPPPPTAFGPNYSEIQANVFTPTCASSSCHGGGAPAAGLNLTSANSYAELVNITSSQDAGFLLVEPNDPDNSYLIQKMEGMASGGGVMPPSGSILQASIDTIRQWISDGAIDDRVVVLDPVQVSSLAPMPNVVLTAPPAQIIAGFTRELVAASVDATTFIVESTGGDGSFTDGSVTQIVSPQISVPAGNPQTAVFDLNGVAMPDDLYRVRLLGNGGAVISDLDANALDGEFAGGFPSGNGTAGGDFQAFFTIDTPVVLGPTLMQIQEIIFTPTCATAGCHNGVGAVLPGVLDLSSEAASLASLVNVVSIQDGNVDRVEPGSPDMSYLITKLESAGAMGGQMPLGQAPLPQADIDQVRLWITNGANP